VKIGRISKYRLEKVCGHFFKKAIVETKIESTSGAFLQKKRDQSVSATVWVARAMGRRKWAI
jgi:hypothetical protein